MSSRLRTFGVRVAFLFALIAAAMAIRVTAGKPTLPVALLQSFDRACSLVERQIAELEQPASPSTGSALATALDRFARTVTDAHEASSARLAAERAHALSDERRFAVAGCIAHHLRLAREDLARATDPDERAEYGATLARLHDLRRRV